jgi:archaemetzincin
MGKIGTRQNASGNRRSATGERLVAGLAVLVIGWLGTTEPVETSWAQVDTGAPGPSSRVPGIRCVAIQPLGEVAEDSLTAVRQAIIALYGFEVLTLDAVELPETAYYEPRNRYRAERLLDFLAGLRPADCDRILGVTTRDISTTSGEHEDWGILGLAILGGHEAVISRYRTRRRLADVSADERLGRVAVHEIGHTLGLPHCPTEGCYLQDANGSVLTVDGETALCERCRAAVGWVE